MEARAMVLHRAVVSLFAVAMFTASASGCAPGDDPTYWSDTKPIFDGVCLRCHAVGGIAPMPLTTFEEVYPFRARIREEVAGRTMPPWLPGPGCNEYAGDYSLSDDQVDTIVAWVDAGAPEGNEGDAVPPLEFPTLELSRVDLTLSMEAPYTPSDAAPDEFRCFVLEWPEQGTTYVTGFRARPGNPVIVHHVITSVVPPAGADLARDLAGEDAAPGYTCFGDDGVGGAMLGAWAPGISGTDYPADTGILVEPGSVLVLQVHYNTIEGGGEPDETSIDLKLEPAVSSPATMLTLIDPGAISGLFIPAGAADVDVSYRAPVPAAARLHFAAVHMHLLGTAGSLVVERGDGSTTCVLDVPNYDFHWQMLAPLATPVTVGPTDTVRWACEYDNSAANQPLLNGVAGDPIDVVWGEGTTEEMCVGVLYVTPE